MRKRIKKLAALLCSAAIVSSFAGCGGNEPPVATPTDTQTQTAAQNTATTAKPDDAPVFMLEKLPEIGEYVDDIIYNRRYPEIRKTLTPGEDYGKLIPFVGSFRDYNFVDYETGEWEDETYSVSKYGLMTDKGEIVVDAVYDWATINTTDNGDYYIVLSMAGEEFETTAERLFCTSDGSFARVVDGSVYINLNSYDDGYIIVTDSSEVDWESSTGAPKTIVYDKKWNKLFEFDNCNMHGEECFVEGYLALSFFSDYSNYEYKARFVDKEGNLAFDGVHPKGNFENGKVAAINASGKQGLFSSDGNWVVTPVYNEFDKIGNYYIGYNDFSCVIYDSDGKTVDIISKSVLGDQGIEAYGDRIFLNNYLYDETKDEYYSEFTLLPENETIVRKETGTPVTRYIYGTEYFCCHDGEYTYIVNFDGRTVARLEGVGIINKIDDNHFEFREGSWEDETQNYSVYSFNGFKKLWSDKLVNRGNMVEIWGYDTYMVRAFASEGNEGELVTDYTYEIISIETGKPILDNITGYYCFDVNGETYYCVTDGTYTYTYAPDMTLLMKNRNNINDD